MQKRRRLVKGRETEEGGSTKAVDSINRSLECSFMFSRMNQMPCTSEKFNSLKVLAFKIKGLYPLQEHLWSYQSLFCLAVSCCLLFFSSALFMDDRFLKFVSAVLGGG